MKKYGLIVAGGGLSGWAAAVCAAREGVKTLLIEQSNCLGGASSNCLVNPFMPYTTKIDGNKVTLCKGIFQDLTHRLRQFSARCDQACLPDEPLSVFNEEYLKIVLSRMLLESGAEVLLRSSIIQAAVEDGAVTKVKVFNKSGLRDFSADYYIDATGDADLTAMAGFSFRLGRDGDQLCQPMTLCFRIGNVDLEGYRQIKLQISPLYQEWKKAGKITNSREDVLIFSTLTEGVLHFNSTRVVKLNPTDAFDVTKAEMIAREQALELFLFLKENFHCFKNSHILSTAAQIGVRESRMIDGEYLLTGNDLRECKKFKDAIALGNYDIDIHNPEGEGTSHYFFPEGAYYTIPYRALIPKGSHNLLTVGRCISVDHEAQASIRIMPIVCCMGEAAGVAMALAKSSHTGVSQVDVSALREKLLQNGAELGLNL